MIAVDVCETVYFHGGLVGLLLLCWLLTQQVQYQHTVLLTKPWNRCNEASRLTDTTIKMKGVDCRGATYGCLPSFRKPIVCPVHTLLLLSIGLPVQPTRLRRLRRYMCCYMSLSDFTPGFGSYVESNGVRSRILPIRANIPNVRALLDR